MSRLHPVPDNPERAIGLIRVSKEREGMISPEVQRNAIAEYAAMRGYEVVKWIEGLDESGSRAKSAWWPRLDQAVAEVEAGTAEVLVTWKFSRAARHRLRWAVAIDRVEEAGGRLESATERVDTTTSTGRFTRGMLAELQAFEAERIGEVWQEAHQRRVRAGMPHSGRAKWGYTYDRETKRHLPDPLQGPVLADLYRRYIAGESMYGLARWLNGHGWHTLSGGAWSDRTLRRVLDSGFAAGFFSYAGQQHQGVHEPLIDAATWQAYLDARSARRTTPARVERSQYLLSGMVRCARCGGSMVANYVDGGDRLSRRAKGRAEGRRYSNGRPRMTFRCKRGKETGRCQGGYVSMRLVEEHVLEHLRGLAAQVDEQASIRVVRDARRTLLEAEEQRLSREAARIEEALVALAVRDAQHPMAPATYAAARRELDQRSAELQAALEVVGRAHRRAPADRAAAAAHLLEEWHDLPVTGRREMLGRLIDCVLVRTGQDAWMRVVEWAEVRP